MQQDESRPWTMIPNPLGFPDLYAQSRSAIVAPTKLKSYDPTTGLSVKRPRVPQRKVPYAKDWLGRSFTKGDLLLGTGGSENIFFEVDEILLDDSLGQPYLDDCGGILVDTNDSNVYQLGNNRRDRTTIQLIDPSWIGTQLGLVLDPNPHFHHYYRDVPSNFRGAHFQSFKVRAKPISGDKRRSLTQNQITVVGEPLDRRTLELYLAAKEVPLVGDPIKF